MKRCAIYTRKSSKEDLEQEFNSLHAQREACEAFIKSQKHEGWQCIKKAYDDGGISGGTMERPALKRLLSNIAQGRVDVIVVYKVDRLTRPLADFAKMVELFDTHHVSFVSVTQQFNTTSSMGRLTLNVLLSFAQFEREVTSERIRDKITASKKKGMWIGGNVPLGYEVKDRKLLVNTEEAKIINSLYTHYLKTGCVRLLKEELDNQGIVTHSGKCSFSRGALYKLLSNPVYLGKIKHKDICYPGQHEAIIPQELWDKVQETIATNRNGDTYRVRKSEASLLAGKLFDTSGNALTIVHTNKKGKRYRYYVLKSLITGIWAESSDGWRLPGKEIEKMVIQSIVSILADANPMVEALQKAEIASHHIADSLNVAKHIIHKIKSNNNIDAIVSNLLERVELKDGEIRITLSLSSLLLTAHPPATLLLIIPLHIRRRGVEMRLVVANHQPAKRDSVLIKNIARAHSWFHELLWGKVASLAEIALRENLDKGTFSRMMNLAFIAPDRIDSILHGHQPVTLTTEKLLKNVNLPLCWQQQRTSLGFA